MRYLPILLMIVPLSGVTQVDSGYARKQEPFEMSWVKYEPLKKNGTAVIGDGATVYLGAGTSFDVSMSRRGLLHFLVEFDEPFQGVVKSVEYYVSYSCLYPENDTIISNSLWSGPKATGESFSGLPFSPKRGNLNNENYETAQEIVDLYCYNEHTNRSREFARLFWDLDWRNIEEHGDRHTERRLEELYMDNWPNNNIAHSWDKLFDEWGESVSKKFEPYPDLHERLLKLLDSSDTR